MLDENELQEMLNAVTKYGRDYDVRFCKKDQGLVVNGDDSDHDETWMLGGNELKKTK